MAQQQLTQSDAKAQSTGRRRRAVQILSFISALVYCICNEIWVGNSVANLDSNDLNWNPNVVNKSFQTAKQIESSRKWKHIRTNVDSTSARVTFQLHPPSKWPIDNVFNQERKCPLGNLTTGKGTRTRKTGEVRSGELPTELVRVDGGRVLDFTTTISTSLKLLSIGDSVTIQLSEAIDESLGGRQLNSRTILWETWIGHDGGTVVWPTFGGGAAATWRMTGLLSRSREGKPPPNNPGGGWSMTDVKRFLDHEMVRQYKQMDVLQMTQPQPIKLSDAFESAKRNATIGSFDVVTLRVMHGWMKTEEITPDRLLEAIHLASELFGVECVILQTIPFTNNVKTAQDLNEINKLNDVVRNISHTWNPVNSTLPLKNVLVQEFGQYYNHIIWSNGRHLGYNVSRPLGANPLMFQSEGPDFLYDRLKDGKQWSPSIAMVCSDMNSLGSKRDKCNRNYLFSDGMHVCPESMASRYAASLACLMGCVYNSDQVQNKVNLRSCEKECNELFMSVMPVHGSWVDDEVTLASYA
ncbi:hypothetical protein ACHAW6_015581 [Cyclotella cf. meneghiniana]